MDIDIDKEEYPDLTENQVLNNITVYNDDVVDGFELTTDIYGYDNTNDFFLFNGKIISKEIMPVLSEEVNEIEERMDIVL